MHVARPLPMLYGSAVPIGTSWERALDGATLRVVDLVGETRQVAGVGQVPAFVVALLLMPRWAYDLLLIVGIDADGRPSLIGLECAPAGDEELLLRGADLEDWGWRRHLPGEEIPRRYANRGAEWTPLAHVLADFPLHVLEQLVRPVVGYAAHRWVLEQAKDHPELAAVISDLPVSSPVDMAQVRPRRRRNPITSDLLERAAAVYRANVSTGRPTEAVGTALHVSRSQASEYVRLARERGYLGAALGPTPGEALAEKEKGK